MDSGNVFLKILLIVFNIVIFAFLIFFYENYRSKISMPMETPKIIETVNHIPKVVIMTDAEKAKALKGLKVVNMTDSQKANALKNLRVNNSMPR